MCVCYGQHINDKRNDSDFYFLLKKSIKIGLTQIVVLSFIL